MEINIPSDVIVSELMKDYYTKKEVEDLLDTLKESILAEIKLSARISFEGLVVEEKTKTTKKKTAKKSADKTDDKPLTLPEIPDEKNKSGVVSFEPITKPSPVVNNGVQVVERNSGVRPKPRQDTSKYEFIDVNPAIFGNGM